MTDQTTTHMPSAPIEAADHIDPVRYAEVTLTDEQSAALAHDVVVNLMAKVDAGARLFFAIYHHPQAKELFASEFMTHGFIKGYMAASAAYLTDPQRSVTTDG
jgi:hypothetical protein